MELRSFFSAHRLIVLYICIKFMKISQKVSELLRRQRFSYSNFQRGIILSKMQAELPSLFSAHCLVVLYICIKFHENISKGFRAFERTRFVTDRQTDNYGFYEIIWNLNDRLETRCHSNLFLCVCFSSCDHLIQWSGTILGSWHRTVREAFLQNYLEICPKTREQFILRFLVLLANTPGELIGWKLSKSGFPHKKKLKEEQL